MSKNADFMLAVVFNLYPFSPEFWLPNAFLADLDALGQPSHIRQKAIFDTMKSYGVEPTPMLEKCFVMLDRLAPKSLETRFSPPKSKKPNPLLELLKDQLIRKTIEQFVHREMHGFLQFLIENKQFLTKDAERKVIVGEFLITPGPDLHGHFFFKKNVDNLQSRLALAAENERPWWPHTREIVVLTNDIGWILVGWKLHKIDGMRGFLLKSFLKKEVVEVPRPRIQEYFKKVILPQTDRGNLDRINQEGFEIRIDEKARACHLQLVQLPLGNQPWVFRATFIYADEVAFIYGEKRTHKTQILFVGTEDISLLQTRREVAREAQWIDFLKTKNLVETEPFLLQLVDNESFSASFEWLAGHKNELELEGFVVAEPFLEDKKVILEGGEISFSSRRDHDWFDLFGVVKIGQFEIPFGRFLKNIRDRAPLFQLPDARWWLIPDAWFEKYESLAIFGKEHGEQLRFSKKHELMLPPIFGAKKPAQPAENLQILDGQDGFVAEIFPSKKLKAELYPYQLAGFRWLVAHFEQGNGALLADEMGLGKTLQTIALLLHAKENNAEKKEDLEPEDSRLQLDLFRVFEQTVQPMRALIVAPASILFNWEREILRFAPDLFVYRHAGAARHRSARDLMGQDIVLTTYQTVLTDVELLQKINWKIVVLDEAHVVKNRRSDTAKALRSIPANNRLALTGTPIENSLDDFFSQMDWLNPQLLGSAAFFQTHFSAPISKNRDARRLEMLRNLTTPFVLRRTKNLVAADLPSLTEKFIFSEMSDPQQDIYEREKSSVRNLLSQPNALVGINYTKYVLPALVRLRQLACHPILVKKDFEGDSGKFLEIIEMWREVHENGHKVLIFSSFVQHLGLLRDFFKKEKISFAWLTGENSTAERTRAVDDFSEKTDVRVMLCSLKAGGVGLNLTAADYVFLLDPWWNPAAEKQAIARAHRGGQTRPVIALRFVTRGTIEEKIIELQRRKTQLFDDLFDFENNPTLGGDDLAFLLE